MSWVNVRPFGSQQVVLVRFRIGGLGIGVGAAVILRESTSGLGLPTIYSS